MTTYESSTLPGGAATGTDDNTSSKAGAAADAARHTAGTAREQAGQVGQQAAARGSEVAQTAKEQAREVVGEASRQARNVTGELRDQATQQATQQRDKAAETLRSLSGELQQMADAGQSGMASSLAKQLSTQVDNVAGYLEQREPGEMVNDLRAFASRRAGTFLLGAALTGVLAGRLVKGATAASSSGSGSSPQQGTSGYAGEAPPYASGIATVPAGEAGTYSGLAGAPTGSPHGDPYASLPGGFTGQETQGLRNPTTGPLAQTGPSTYGSPTSGTRPFEDPSGTTGTYGGGTENV